MKNIINLLWQEQILGHILSDEAVILASCEVLNVGQVTGHQIIDRDDPMAFGKEAICQMRAEKTGATGDDGNGLRFVGMCGHRAPYLTAGTSICEQKEGEIQFQPDTQSYRSKFADYALDFRDGLGFNLK